MAWYNDAYNFAKDTAVDAVKNKLTGGAGVGDLKNLAALASDSPGRLPGDIQAGADIRSGYQADLAAAQAAAGQAPTMALPTMAAAPTATAATINTQPQGQFRQGQQDLAGSLQGVISGTAGPSVAELQGQRSLARNIAGQMSMAAGARGPNIALARRTAAMNAGQLGAQSAADSALLRAHETAQARDQLGGVLSAGRGADIGLATGQAGLEQQTGLANQGAQLATNQGNLNAALTTGQANLGSQLTSRAQDINEQAGIRGDITAQQGQLYGADKAVADINAKGKDRVIGLGKDVINAGIGALPALTSDRRLKTDVAPESDDVMHEFLTAVDPKSFRYKTDDPKADRHGVMAQDIARSRIGKALVHDTPGGKMIDVPQAVGALMAAAGFMHGRLKKIEIDHKPLSETIGMMGGHR